MESSRIDRVQLKCGALRPQSLLKSTKQNTKSANVPLPLPPLTDETKKVTQTLFLIFENELVM